MHSLYFTKLGKTQDNMLSVLPSPPSFTFFSLFSCVAEFAPSTLREQGREQARPEESDRQEVERKHQSRVNSAALVRG